MHTNAAYNKLSNYIISVYRMLPVMFNDRLLLLNTLPYSFILRAFSLLRSSWLHYFFTHYHSVILHKLLDILPNCNILHLQYVLLLLLYMFILLCILPHYIQCRSLTSGDPTQNWGGGGVGMKEWMKRICLCFTPSWIALAESARETFLTLGFFVSCKRLYDVHVTWFEWLM